MTWQSEAVIGMPRWARESLGLATAIAISVLTVAAVTASERSELVFRDGDSLVTTLVVRSLASGQPQDWALSTVLFLPEIAALGVLTLLGLGVNGTLALAGVVNLVAFYGALRVAAGRPGAGSVARPRALHRPVAGALLAFATFALLAATQTSPSRDALQLASLLLTTTYYSATVIAVVLAVGIARHGLERSRRPGVGRSRRPGVERSRRPGAGREGIAGREGVVGRRRGVPWRSVAAIGAVAAASVLTNPLFAVWATVPLGLVLGAVWLVGRTGSARRGVAVEAGTARHGTLASVAAWLAGALVAGTAIGFAGRMPLASLIANSGAGYADVARWPESLAYYGGLLAERWSAPWGAASVVLVLVLWGWSVIATVLLARRRDVPAALVAACGWAMPLLVTVGAIALGTHAARYLQPVEFAVVLGLVVVPDVLAHGARRGAPVSAAPARRAARVGAVAAVAVTGLVLVGALGVGVPRVAAAANAPDADVECVVAWTEQSGRVGAGQFWTVRLPKAHLADPRALVQVDHELRGYAWLVDRDDFAAGEVSFLVVDTQSVPFTLPAGISTADAESVSCGRYTILDFGARLLPIGPLRS